MKCVLSSLLLATGVCLSSAIAGAEVPTRGQAVWSIHYDPKTLDPAKVDDQASEYVRYLTAGVLLRLNRSTMAVEPELAESWSVSQDGKLVTLHLRRGLRFSDGSPLTAADAVSSLQRTLTPSTAAPVAEEFLQPTKVVVQAPDTYTVTIRLPVRIVQILTILDEIAIEPAGKDAESKVTSGPFAVAQYRVGESLLLQRNEYYWKNDQSGVRLPYFQQLRLDILTNPETEELRFLRGQYAFLDRVGPDAFNALSRKLPGAFHDLGPSLNTEQMWFNQAASAPIPDYKKRWFTSKNFRTAISLALHRADFARIAYEGHATPANGFVSPANAFWYDRALPPVHEDVAAALKLLAQDGFHKKGSVLYDNSNHPVEFALLTNIDNRSRQRMAALIQQDVAALGIQMNVVTLDFPALIERLMHTQAYEAALLGLTNVQPDPSAMMNIWLSDSPNHQWNPSEKTPATPWEAEIDRAVRAQAESSDPQLRKQAMDKVQSIVAEQRPFIYLVYPNTLCAASPALEGVSFSVLPPDVTSAVERIHWKGDRR